MDRQITSWKNRYALVKGDFSLDQLKEMREEVEAGLIGIGQLLQIQQNYLINLQKQMSARNALYQISQVKNSTLDPDADVSAKFGHPLMHEIFQAYESEKRASRAFDFDDLLLEVLRIFKRKAAFKKAAFFIPTNSIPASKDAGHLR